MRALLLIGISAPLARAVLVLLYALKVLLQY
jgi:hypothetical protein